MVLQKKKLDDNFDKKKDDNFDKKKDDNLKNLYRVKYSAAQNPNNL